MTLADRIGGGDEHLVTTDHWLSQMRAPIPVAVVQNLHALAIVPLGRHGKEEVTGARFGRQRVAHDREGAATKATCPLDAAYANGWLDMADYRTGIMFAHLHRAAGFGAVGTAMGSSLRLLPRWS